MKRKSPKNGLARRKQLRYYHCDQIGAPLALTDERGNIVWAASYDPWGNVREEYNPGNIRQDIRLPGQHQDKHTGLYYNRYRYYDPKLGSYINQDPIGLASGELNFFAYVKNPNQRVDPLGLWDSAIGTLQSMGQSPGWQAQISKAISEREIYERRARTSACPASPPTNNPDWISYNTVGNPAVFHCGYDGYLANVPPTPENPMNECFYDENNNLVDENHPYAACGGTPDQYSGKTHPLSHVFRDSGGVWAEGWPAYQESRRHAADKAAGQLKTTK